MNAEPSKSWLQKGPNRFVICHRLYPPLGAGGLKVSQLYIHPVKSLGGIAKQRADITDTGFKYDRKWMLVDENNLFISQRSCPEMVLLQTAETENGITVFHKQNPQEAIIIPFDNENDEKIKHFFNLGLFFKYFIHIKSLINFK